MCYGGAGSEFYTTILWADGKYLAGAFVGRKSHGSAYVHCQTTEDKSAAIRFCTLQAAESFATALKQAKCGEWQALRLTNA